MTFFLDDGLRKLTTHTGGADDQTFGVLGKQLFIDTRLVVHPLKACFRRKLHEVSVAGFILGEGYKVMVTIPLWIAVAPSTCRDVEFAANNRLNSDGFTRFIELKCPVHRSVIGKRNRWHFHLDGDLSHLLDLGCTIKE